MIYSKTGLIRFISHRDLMRVFFRAFRRAGLPLEYSQGFNPHPRVELCPPLPVGMEGLSEILDMRLTVEMAVPEVLSRLNDSNLPRGIAPREIIPLAEGAPSLGKTIKEVDYRVLLPSDLPTDDAVIAELLSRENIPWVRRREDRVKEIDLRPGILDLRMEERPEGRLLFLTLSLLSPIPRPQEVLACLTGRDPEELQGCKWQRLAFQGESR